MLMGLVGYSCARAATAGSKTSSSAATTIGIRDELRFCRVLAYLLHKAKNARALGTTAMTTRKLISVAATGDCQKMPKLPLDMMSDCRRAVSMIGPSTKARISGAAGYPNLAMR